MNIIFQIDQPFLESVDPDPIKKALQLTMQHFDRFNFTAMTVVITDTETIQQLNRQYRGSDAPTDVLSFANTPAPDFPDLAPGHLGDIVMAYPIAQAQALAAGHEPLEELVLLAVHGALHLLGFDHDTPANKEKMWAVQQQIMAGLGLGHLQPTEN